MSAIQVAGLVKTFQVKRKTSGLGASLRALFNPRIESVEAVRDISFDMDAGERLGFIGPNGAGKSTTIKILTGILFPTHGRVEVLGYTPWLQRKELAFHIGTVFGQRPQLWYHLPPMDTYHLFGKIYEQDARTMGKRISRLAEAFEISEFLDVPVRKLSLGQRMRCEVAASLLHRPRLLLLDEPSIGLDVVAKQRIRDTVEKMSSEEGVGVLLTSHDAGDIEALCKRVIIIHQGVLVYQDKVSNLKRKFLTSKQVDVRYAEEIPTDILLTGVEILKIGRYGLKLRFDHRQTPIESVLSQLSDHGNLVDVTISDPSLEEVIRTIYRSYRPGEK